MKTAITEMLSHQINKELFSAYLYLEFNNILQ
ncbi:MAG: ferritin, partial [Clostridiales bacterium]|nr:ferritin [Clostridiales bacterium]